MAGMNAEMMGREDEINHVIAEGKAAGTVDTNLISDGYHTFGELYDHRIELFVALCRKLAQVKRIAGENVDREVWRSRRQSDGRLDEGWFIMGIGTESGNQISYHLPDSKWDNTGFAETLERAPEFDGHTGGDVLKRLRDL